ncbi:MAG: response regulator [Acidobacteria bacterium]|nr:MAG: response regulator [Acidobacteriota bacterium]
MLQRLRRFGRISSASRHWVPYAVLALGLVSTAAAGLLLGREARERDASRLESAVVRIQNSLTTRIETYSALLRAAAGLFAASERVSLQEFRGFVERLDLRGKYPGIQGIGFAARIPAAHLPATLAALRFDGVDVPRVWPESPRDFYHPIVYLEPLDRRNRAAVGYDMFTEPIRRTAMERAAREGLAATSGRVTLVQEIDPEKQAGFLIYLPVYATGAVPETESQRLRRLRGFVYSPFRAGDFLETVLASVGEAEVSLRIYDGHAPTPEHLLHDSQHGLAAAGSGPDGTRVLSAARSFEVPGRTWTLVVTTLPVFHLGSGSRLLPWGLAGGAVVSFLLFIATRAEVKARASAEAAADGLRHSEEALRASEAELRRLVAAEREANAEAAAASRAKDEFLATLSHELRTPLNAILGWATMMRNGSLAEEQEQRAVEIIARNARVQAELIEDLLDVSRIITGKLHIETRPVTLAPAVEAALDAVRPAAAAKGVSLEWAPSTEGPVLGDPDRLQQVAWNLLSNAIKFTPAGGRVVASLDAVSGHVELRVSDTGVGLSPSFIPHMFQRFRQHDSSTTRSHGGMGLGLAIVRHLVELHGGTVSVSSRGEGHGATFTVRLPARKGGPAKALAADRSRQGVSPDELGGIRALVVDDDRDSLELLAQVLTQAGATVLLASSAGETLDILARQAVDVLLLDIAMPGVDGYALLRSIRAHPSDSVRSLPAVAVTAHARGEDRDRAREAGFQDHLSKPVEMHTLREAVRRLVMQ